MISISVIALTERRVRSGVAVKLADYVELTKPRIAVLELITVAVAAFLATGGAPESTLLVAALTGTALVAGSASAMNQWLERDADARMPRTADRPLPASRLSGREVALFGGLTVILGFLVLALAVNLQTALLGLLTWFLYVCVYTPLKRITPLNTVVGAIAGALPILMGWAAVAPLDLHAATLFMIVYLWQFPHFMAISWIYRHDYAAGGFKMLSVVDPSGRRAGRQAVIAALALLPVSLLPMQISSLGSVNQSLILLLGLSQIFLAARFLWKLDRPSARGLLRISLIYLPVILLLLVWGPI